VKTGKHMSPEMGIYEDPEGGYKTGLQHGYTVVALTGELAAM